LLQLEALRELQLIELNEIRGTSMGTANIGATKTLKLAKNGSRKIKMRAALGSNREGAGEGG
jgi:hypothetical protein